MTEKQIIKLMKFPLTDQGNAERLRFIFGNRWKYLPRYRLWLHWNGHRWEGRRTVNLIWTAGDMFHELILAICHCEMVPPVLFIPGTPPLSDLTKQNVSYNIFTGFGLPKCTSGCSLVVKLQPSKLMLWVRFPSPAPFFV